MNYHRSQLVGTWFRTEVNEQGEQVTETAQLLADGSFEFGFCYYDDKGQLIKQLIELGDWGLVGDIHFTMTKSEFVDEEHYAADLSDEDNYQAYKVLELTNKTFKYQHVVTEDIYVLKRVLDKVGHC